jgi:hypothetical protein
MLIAFERDFAGRKKGDVSTIPDGMAKVLIKKGYVKVTGDEPVKKTGPILCTSKTS